MNDETIVILAAVGVGAYLLYKPIQDAGAGVASGVSSVASGVGSAVSGVGQGVSQISGGIAAPYEYIDARLNLLQQQAQLKYDAQVMALEQSYKTKAEEQLARTIIEQGAKTEREGYREEFKTSWTDALTPTPTEVKSALGLVVDKIRSLKSEPKANPNIGVFLSNLQQTGTKDAAIGAAAVSSSKSVKSSGSVFMPTTTSTKFISLPGSSSRSIKSSSSSAGLTSAQKKELDSNRKKLGW